VLEPITALDGLVAAIYDDTIVTSPNANYVPEVLTTETQVYLRADLRYGTDDATLWPQPFLGKYPYLSVIPRASDMEPGSARSLMWWQPTRENFRQSESALVDGVGMLGGEEVDRLVVEVRTLNAKVKTYREKKELEGSAVVDSGIVTLMHTLARFEHCSGTMEEKCLELSELQRSYLELVSMMDYYTVRMKRIAQCTTAPKDMEKFRKVVGCFTNQPIVAQECYVAGIPVWLIRDYRQLLAGTIRVDAVVEFTRAKDVLELCKRPGVDYRVIFKGQRSADARYTEQRRFMRSRMIWTDPWGGELGDVPNPLVMGRHGVGSKTRGMEELQVKPRGGGKGKSMVQSAAHPCE
jgi:hypothetical protein